MKRKFLTEYALEYSNSYTIQIKAHNLSKSKEIRSELIDKLNTCHIYFITKRPKLYFRKDSLICDENGLRGDICYRINGKEQARDFSIPDKLEQKSLSISCEYPYNELTINYKNKKGVTDVLCKICADTIAYNLKKLNDYEVLYIGQSIGKNCDRNALDRLKSHSTLQEILAETSYHDHDSEIMLFMYAFEYERLLSGTDGANNSVNNSNENIERLLNSLENPPVEKQKIALIEAGLIRYFQPFYNEKYKSNFPDDKHKILQTCSSLDISGLVIQLNCSDYNYSLYSKSVELKNFHIITIDLLKKNDRISFFYSTDIKNIPGIIS